ncbi:MAG: glycogen/starch synthase [Paludibacteraceae bacterium]|nr:glycogen/starch synthase [Candidatus Colousia faecequi]MCQ2338681.1 glycogen/starch synthase [Paludibacteraceae bacterium]
MKKQTKVLFISQEIDPYICESTVATLCRKLPQLAQEHGSEIRVFMPCYGHINERRNQLHEVQRLSGLNIIINDNDHPLVIKVASIQSARVQVYFIDNDDFFKRRGVSCDENNTPFEDNDERSIFYVRSVLETIKKLRWTPDIILCTGWISAFAPLFIKKSYITDPFFATSKVIYTVTPDRIDSPLRPDIKDRLVFDGISIGDYPELNTASSLSSDVLDSLAIRYSDAVISELDNVPNSVLRQIDACNIPLLPYSDQNPGERYFDFFAKICPKFQDDDKL